MEDRALNIWLGGLILWGMFMFVFSLILRPYITWYLKMNKVVEKMNEILIELQLLAQKRNN